MSLSTRLSRVSPAIRQNALYALGIFVMKGVSFVMLPYVTGSLTPTEFGELEVLTSLGALGSILVGFGMLNTLYRFAGKGSGSKRARGLAAEVFGITLVLGGVGLVAGITMSPLLARALPGEVGLYPVVLTVGMITLEGCIAIPLGWLRMNDRADLFFVLSTGKAILQAGLVVLFLEAGRGVAGVMEAGLLSAAALAMVTAALQYRDTGVRWRPGRLRALFTYSLPMVGSGLLGFVLTGLDRWILADHVGTAAMAQYAIAAKFAALAALMLQPFMMWWGPRRIRVLGEPGGIRKAADLAALGSALALVIAVGIGLFAPPAIEMLLPPAYWSAARYVPWLVLLVAIKDSAELLNLGCYTGRTTRAQFFINLAGSLCGLLGMLAWVPSWGIAGAIAGLLLAQVVRLVLYIAVSQRLLPLPYPGPALAGLATLAVALLLAGQTVEGLPAQAALAFAGVAGMLAAGWMLRLWPGFSMAGATR